MRLLGIVKRKELFDFYLGIEVIKKNKPIPADYSPLDLDAIDVNALDAWLEDHGYKPGVISGFRSWAHVELDKNDLLDIAVKKGIFKSTRVLRKLVGTPELSDWIPDKNPLPTWYGPLFIGEFRDDFSIILRAATPGEKREGAKLYVEDGSGRSICYFRTLLRTGMPSQMRGYIGFDPDPQSYFFQTLLEGEFAITCTNKRGGKYKTFEQLLDTISRP
jgi:hypothetical protein